MPGYHTDPPELVSVLSGASTAAPKHDITTMAAATGARAVFPTGHRQPLVPARPGAQCHRCVGGDCQLNGSVALSVVTACWSMSRLVTPGQD